MWLSGHGSGRIVQTDTWQGARKARQIARVPRYHNSKSHKTRHFEIKTNQVRRDYRARAGKAAPTAKPAWHPANHPKFNEKSEFKQVFESNEEKNSNLFFRILRVITKCPWSGTQRQAGSIIATILVKWLHLLADKINNKFNWISLPLAFFRKNRNLVVCSRSWNSKSLGTGVLTVALEVVLSPPIYKSGFGLFL